MHRFKIASCWALVVLAAAGTVTAQDEKPLLLQKPAVGGARIAFVYAGDIWTVGRSRRDAVRLTTGPGIETDPVFSPDGEQVAFTGDYDGNVDPRAARDLAKLLGDYIGAVNGTGETFWSGSRSVPPRGTARAGLGAAYEGTEAGAPGRRSC